MTATAPTEINLEELFTPNGQALKTIRHYARKLVKLKVFPESEVEDVEQDLALRLLRRIRRFEAERSSIATFVDRAVRYEAFEIFRTRCKPTHVRQRTTRSLDAITVQRGNMPTPVVANDMPACTAEACSVATETMITRRRPAANWFQERRPARRVLRGTVRSLFGRRCCS